MAHSFDTHEFRITADDTLDAFARALESQGLTGCDATAEDGRLTIEFSDGMVMTVDTDATTHRLHLHAGPAVRSFYYHPVEEAWFEDEREEDLRAVLGDLVGSRLGLSVSLDED